MGQGVGYAPRVNPIGFPYTPSPSPSLRFGPGSPGIYYINCGMKNGDGNQKCVRAVFKGTYQHPANVAGTYVIPVVRLGPRDNASGYGGGFCIYDGSGTLLTRRFTTLYNSPNHHNLLLHET
ncbi:hypothetical protein FTUN_6306 [Frigoriglobus tundricola]|uniref:Uncharacterized protein n=1 Tax=Frigoriglobus tundricola TaxID=2774151 RepID=A0A6M5YZS0_9BACT|nr:hypothetical protein FTUN_6306 [Frigoriglobus tundricola]